MSDYLRIIQNALQTDVKGNLFYDLEYIFTGEYDPNVPECSGENFKECISAYRSYLHTRLDNTESHLSRIKASINQSLENCQALEKIPLWAAEKLHELLNEKKIDPKNPKNANLEELISQ